MEQNLELRELLSRVAAGGLSVEEALELVPLLQIEKVQEFARLDIGRHRRKGVPEVVFASGKSDERLAAVVAAFVRASGLALVSRLEPERLASLESRLEEEDLGEYRLLYDREARILEVVLPGYVPPARVGTVGVLTAGTSDIPVAEEAALVARHMGCTVERAYDVGVAGVHRLLEPLADMMRAGVDVLVVAAGMEGALPSVVAGLVDTPVIGVPTSTGYGVGGGGVGALYSILQSCSPGLVAVNVDNGVGAGAAAGLIARRNRERAAR